MNLYDAILAIENWNQQSANQLHDILTTPSVEYVDLCNYTWGGVADVLGNDTTEALREALDSGSRWAVFALGGHPGLQLCRDDIQQKLYALENSGLVLGAAKLARHVRRMKTPLECYGIEASLQDIQKALEELKVAATKKNIEDGWNDRLQAARELLTVWSGDPATEPQL